MAINFNNSLIGLSLLTGSARVASGFAGLNFDSPAVLAAKKAFTLPSTTPPWQEAPAKASMSSQIAELKRLSSLVDARNDNKLEKLPDVQTAFKSYKTLDRLRLLAEMAAKPTTSSAERAVLDKIFAKGLTDLQSYLGKAETQLLNLNFTQNTRRSDSVGISTPDSSGKVKAETVADSRAAPLKGVTGNEILTITLSRRNISQMVTVDLSTTPQPPTLDSVAAALNAAIAAPVAMDANGQPILDSNGEPAKNWNSHFTVEKDGDHWGLVFHPSGAEKASIDQANATDALMIASGRTAKDGPTSAQIFRIANPEDHLAAERLSTINAIDRAATAKAQAEAKTKAEKTAGDKKNAIDENQVQHIVYAPTSARGIATDAQGFSYVVGTTAGDLGSTLSDGKNDLYLTKVDSEGRTIWMRSLGAAGTGDGVAVTVTDAGKIMVAGTVSGAFNGSDDRETDMLVAQFDSQGVQDFATAVRQIGNQNATTMTVGDDGSIYVAGRSGSTATLVRLDANGRVQERHNLDAAGSNSITALAMDANGQLLALTKNNSEASLMRFDAQSLSNPLGSIALGTVDARALTVSDSGEIAIVGATSVATQGSQANGISGGRDAFVMRLSNDLSSQITTYIGTGDNDQADSVAYMNGALYVGGRTNGAINGVKHGSLDGFVARVDLASNSIADVHQWGLIGHSAERVEIAAVSGGATALGALGLARGALNPPISTALSSQTALKEGDIFSLRVDGGAVRSITIAKDESMASLAQKIQRITGNKGSATTAKVDGQLVLRIQVNTGHDIELIAGAEGRDALAKLGIDPVRLSAPAPKPKNAPKVTPGGVFNLNLSTTISLTDAKLAAEALNKVKSAISMTQSAYRSLYWDDGKAAQVDENIVAKGSAYQNARLAQYQAALTRLGG